MSAGPLAGKRVLVTRPREQAAGLAELIREEGGEPIVFPAIEIAAVADLRQFYSVADRLEQFDLAIFISPTAVQRVLGLLEGRRWPERVQVAAIGGGSKRELEQRGFAGVVAPSSGETDSEALLALPEFATVRGRSIVIFRGQGGREFLGNALSERGARIEYAECYRRILPAVSLREPEWAREALDAVTVSSSEGLANLVTLLGAWRRDWLRESALFVPHSRVAAEAARLGARETIVAGSADCEVARALIAYFRAAK
jgi:uroporphyrinogen-III synthase